MTTRPTRPSTRPHRPSCSDPKRLYRRGVWCEMCGAPRTFHYDTGHWVCSTCQFVQMRDGVPVQVWVY